jgi:hypothetical protein
MRIIRLALGIIIIIQAIDIHDWMLGIAGTIFAAMAFMNAGCCGTACYTKPIKETTPLPNTVIYEEVDNK